MTALSKKEHRHTAVFLFGLTHGREQGGAPQRAKNVPGARFLARGRVPAGRFCVPPAAGPTSPKQGESPRCAASASRFALFYKWQKIILYSLTIENEEKNGPVTESVSVPW